MTVEPEAAATPQSFCIIVPAHNEATRGFGVLSTLEDAAKRLNARVIVVCNGCTDNTADVARRAAGVEVLELTIASKAAALNAGDELAGDVFPRLYLDADVHITADALGEIAGVLGAATGGAIAGPVTTYLLDASPWLVRRYYAALAEIPFLVRLSSDLMVGRGLYGVNAAGRSRFDVFPPLTADDGFIDRLFEPDEKHVVDGAVAGIPLPTSLDDFFRAKVRAAAGTKELTGYLAVHRPDRLAADGALPDPRLNVTSRIQHHLRDGGLFSSRRPIAIVDLLVYFLVEVVTRTRLSLAAPRGPWR
jgi:glycosyltransferase involved in cell wall biosynthesis